MKKIIPAAIAVMLTASFTAVPAEALITDIAKEVCLADVNNDGSVTESDFSRYQNYLLGDLSLFQKDIRTDAYCDNRINILDLIKVRKILDGAETLWTKETLPVMDGSTSAIPLEAGFKSRALGISYNSAYSMVNHHKTHESFSMLLSGENDMIFTVPISESQQKQADEAGVHLNFVPVAKEGFVFIVNKNNPVNSLTREQIKGIYSGEITNWKEVGGDDKPIIAYQRNSDSGSQNLIVEFMGDRKLMKPENKGQSPISTMGSLIDHVIAYDNSEQAIGYSVYSYAAQMYENASDVKFIAVDGVEPSKTTLADGSYPLISSTYALFTDNAPESIRKFVNWCTSTEGQLCVLQSGYLPVHDMELPESLIPYSKLGTGKEKSEDYKPDYLYSHFNGSIDYSEGKTEISFLKDKKIQKKINEELNSFIQNELEDRYRKTKLLIRYEAINGYISFSIENSIDTIATLTFDMRDGTRLKNFSDLFYKNTKFVPVLNDVIADKINSAVTDYSIKKADFTGLTGNIEKFTVSKLWLPDENPYLSKGEYFSFSSDDKNDFNSNYLTEYMVTGSFFDMSPMIESSELKKYQKDYFGTINYAFRNEWWYKRAKNDEGKGYYKLEDSVFHTKEETEKFRNTIEIIFAQAEEKYTNTYYTVNTPQRKFQETTLDVLVFYYYSSPYSYKYMFNKEGTRIYFSDIFGKEFSELDDLLFNIKEISMENNEVIASFDIKEDDKIQSKTETRNISFDPDNINKDYFITSP